MNLVDGFVRIKDERKSILESWCDDKGYIVAVGEAAHCLNVSRNIPIITDETIH